VGSWTSAIAALPTPIVWVDRHLKANLPLSLAKYSSEPSALPERCRQVYRGTLAYLRNTSPSSTLFYLTSFAWDTYPSSQARSSQWVIESGEAKNPIIGNDRAHIAISSRGRITTPGPSAQGIIESSTDRRN